jgi:hypothetical protein
MTAAQVLRQVDTHVVFDLRPTSFGNPGRLHEREFVSGQASVLLLPAWRGRRTPGFRIRRSGRVSGGPWPGTSLSCVRFPPVSSSFPRA